MSQTKTLFNTKRLKVWYDPRGRAGNFPTLVAARKGNNGSPAGFGPKMWPTWFKRVARYDGRDNGGIIRWNLPVR